MEHNNQNALEQSHGSFKSYVIGFILSIIFTIIPFILVQNEMLSKLGLVVAILSFASLQLFIQLFFFMHLNTESKPRLYSQAFWFAVFTLVVFVGGSAWVMFELAYYMMH